MPPNRVHASPRPRDRVRLTPLGSLLVVAARDEAKFAEALASGAQAVIIDLDLVAGAKPEARALAGKFLKEARARGAAPSLMVRISPLGEETEQDLDAVMPAAPAAIVLPRSLGGASVQQLSAKLAVREALCGLDDGATGIIAVADTAQAVLEMASYRGSSARLIGLAWDAEALRADIGAETHRDARGAYAGPCRLARDLTLIAAAAAGAAAIDAPFPRPQRCRRTAHRSARCALGRLRGQDGD